METAFDSLAMPGVKKPRKRNQSSLHSSNKPQNRILITNTYLHGVS